jgi:hypothetical protein
MMTYDPSQSYAWGGMSQHPLLAGALQGGGIQHPLLAAAALQSQFGGGIQHPLLALGAIQGGGIQHPLLAAAMQNPIAPQTFLGGQGAWGGGRG